MKFLSRVEQFEKIKIHYRLSKKKMLCFGIIDSQYSRVWLKLKCIKISGEFILKEKTDMSSAEAGEKVKPKR